MLVFKSKVDTWFWLISISVSALVLWQGWQVVARGTEGMWFVLVQLMLVPGLFLWLALSTRYTLTDELLYIRCGPVRKVVRLASITRIENTRNPLSSPALSMDRLAIHYDKHRFVMISPEDKSAFLAALRDRGVTSVPG
jgi:hypothetical protein